MDEADNKANGENMELLEGKAEFTKEKVDDENIINPPLLPVDRKFPLNLFLTPSLSNRLSCWYVWLRKLARFNTTLSSFDFQHSKR